MTSTVVATRPAGRPRDERIDAAILEATLALLADRGYAALSIAAVAETAGVGKPAIYRRYDSKAELVVAAIEVLADEPEPALPDDTRAALTELLAATAAVIASPGGLAIMGSLLAAGGSEPELIEAFRERVVRPRHEVVDAVLARAAERGELRADADLEALDAMLFGAVLARATLGETLDHSWVERIVDTAWAAVAADER
ncbi:MAG: TetR/AcrR family transcriptional regulator [Candidatus Limnocylindrales bacterium]